MNRFRLLPAAVLLAAVAIAAPGARLSAAPRQPEPAAAGSHQSGAVTREPAGHEEAGAARDSWKPVVAKTVNFSILVGVLVYFLRAPLMGYLNGRIGKVREDLVTAEQTRETAVRQLAEIDKKLAALPAEIDALKRRGAEDIAAERVRIEQDAQAERQRLLEYMRREIEMRLRVAKSGLLDAAASLAVDVASERIRQSITPDDQARLVDRYASQVTSQRARQ